MFNRKWIFLFWAKQKFGLFGWFGQYFWSFGRNSAFRRQTVSVKTAIFPYFGRNISVLPKLGQTLISPLVSVSSNLPHFWMIGLDEPRCMSVFGTSQFAPIGVGDSILSIIRRVSRLPIDKILFFLVGGKHFRPLVSCGRCPGCHVETLATYWKWIKIGMAILGEELGPVLNVLVPWGRSRVQVPAGAQNILLFYDLSSFLFFKNRRKSQKWSERDKS